MNRSFNYSAYNRSSLVFFDMSTFLTNSYYSRKGDSIETFYTAKLEETEVIILNTTSSFSLIFRRFLHLHIDKDINNIYKLFHSLAKLQILLSNWDDTRAFIITKNIYTIWKPQESSAFGLMRNKKATCAPEPCGNIIPGSSAAV